MKPSHGPFLVVLAALSFSTMDRLPAADPASLARRIDAALQAELERAQVPASPAADDAQFLRRVTLDITGRIPTAEQGAAFLDDTAADKRAKLVDALLDQPRYGEYLASRWTDLFVANGTPPRSTEAAFRRWLAAEFNAGRGWNEIVRKLLSAAGTAEESPESWYLRANIAEPGLQASTMARYFLGVQVQCAECHDHPFVDWKQGDYWGLAAFFTRLNQVRLSSGQKLTEERPANKAPPAAGTGARIVIGTNGVKVGKGNVVMARFLSGSEPSLPDVGPILPALADWVTAQGNPWFARAAVNRTWAHFFGTGFVAPLDDFQPGATPLHAALLDELAAEFVTSGHDLKHLIRGLCNSQAYQRSSQPLAGNRDDATRFSHQAVKVMPPDVLFDSLVVAMGNPKLTGGLGSPLPYELYSPKSASTSKPPAREEFIRFFNTRADADNTTDYSLGIPQILALMNARSFNAVPPIVDKLVKDDTQHERAIEHLYLATLSRRPTADESRLLCEYVAKRPDARQGYSGVLWILFNSAEFVLNP